MARKFRTPRWAVVVISSGDVIVKDVCRTTAEKIARSMNKKSYIVKAKSQYMMETANACPD